MSRDHTTPDMWEKLEDPECSLCGSDRRQFAFRLHEPYRIACCEACGFHYLYPRLMEGAMQEAYRQPSYYEEGACGYADTSYTAPESGAARELQTPAVQPRQARPIAVSRKQR
jgi:hypothetical protein